MILDLFEKFGFSDDKQNWSYRQKWTIDSYSSLFIISSSLNSSVITTSRTILSSEIWFCSNSMNYSFVGELGYFVSIDKFFILLIFYHNLRSHTMPREIVHIKFKSFLFGCPNLFILILCSLKSESKRVRIIRGIES